MVGVSASINLPLHHKVQKFSSDTSLPGWSRKKGRKTVVVWWCGCLGLAFCVFFWCSLDYFVLVFAFVVLGFLVSSVLHQEIGWEERPHNDLFCVEWDVGAP